MNRMNIEWYEALNQILEPEKKYVLVVFQDKEGRFNMRPVEVVLNKKKEIDYAMLGEAGLEL